MVVAEQRVYSEIIGWIRKLRHTEIDTRVAEMPRMSLPKERFVGPAPAKLASQLPLTFSSPFHHERLHWSD